MGGTKFNITPLSGFLLQLLLALFRALFPKCELKVAWMMLLTKPWSRGRQPKLRLETLDRGRGLGRAEWDTWATDSKACSLEIHHPSPRLVFTASSRFCNSVHTNKVCGLKVTALESFAFKQCSSDSHFRNPFLRTILKSLQYTFNYRTSLWVANLNLLKVVLTFRKRHKPFVVKSWD